MNRHSRKYHIVLIAALFLPSPSLYSLTLVYNLKIRRAFDARLFVPTWDKRKIEMTALPIFYWHKKHIALPTLGQDIHEKVHLVGSIFNIRGSTENRWWAEITTGVEKETIRSTGTQDFKISGVGVDDIVISVGKNTALSEKIELVTYALGGCPFDQDVTLKESQTTLVGSRFYGLGAGAEVSYAFIKSPERAFVGFVQARLVHFFNRKWYPLLPLDGRIKPGNLTDLFLVIRYREKKNAIEVGYNATLSTNQSATVDNKDIKAPNYNRNFLYTTYEYLFEQSPVLKAPGAAGIGLNVGTSKLFETKIVSGWVNVTLLF